MNRSTAINISISAEEAARLSDIEILALLGDRHTTPDQRSRLFGDLYNRYANDLYNYILMHFTDNTFAGDVMQEIFLSLWRRVNSGNKPPLTNFRTWLFLLARQEIMNTLRRTAYNRETVYIDPYAEIVDEHHELDQVELNTDSTDAAKHIMSELQKIATSQEIELLQLVLEGYSAAEIAHKLGSSVSAVSLRKRRLLVRLKRALQEVGLLGERYELAKPKAESES
jgi:RNA polymerase sigma-70 factor (ECF subfamily)